MLKTACFSLALLLTSAVHAVSIVGVTVSANVGDFSAPPFSTLLDTATFQTLTGSQLTDVTDVSSFGWFADALSPVPVVINYNLNGLFLLSQLGFWNAATPNSGNSALGFENVLIETSTDNVQFNVLVGGGFAAGVHTFAQAIDQPGNPAEIVGFNPVVASFVRFTVQSTFAGFNQPGYQAVIFDGVAAPAVPEMNCATASLPVGFLTILCLVGTGRRKSATSV